MIKKTFMISLAAFFLLLSYFYFTYQFHPSMSASFQGHIPKDIRGTVSWDYGNGFLERNSIEVLLTSNKKSLEKSSLGKVTIEPSGLKNDGSRGYSVWLVISEYDYNNPDFIVEGRHHWGHWVVIKTNKRGRQLVLYPGAKIVFNNSSADFRVKVFKTSQSGIAKISSEYGEDQYYDSYGKNRKWGVSWFNYYRSSAGTIKFVKDPYRKRFLTALPLPHQEIYGLKFQQFLGDSISSVKAISQIRLKPTGDTYPLVVKNLLINGKSAGSTDQRVRYQGEWHEDDFHFLSESDFLEINGVTFSYDFDISATQRDDLAVLIDNKENSKQRHQVQKGALLHISGQAIVSKTGFDLRSMELMDTNGQAHTIKTVSRPDGEYLFENLNTIKQDKFSQLLFSTQMFTAAIIAMLFYCLLKLPIFSETKSLKQLPRALFISQGRWLFWLVLFSGLLSNMLWLFAEWPGALTPDTVHVHSEVKRLLLTNHHPYLYSLFILALYNLYDAPLTVVLFQIISFYTLLAWWLYFLYRNGVRWFVLLPLYFLTFFSVPVNILNITVWKDIPYNTLVLFWAFFLTGSYYLKQKGRTFELTIPQLILLSFAFLFLCTFRHNGLVYFPVIPFCLLCFTNISKKWFAGFVVLSSLLLFLSFQVLPGYILYDKPKKNDFAQEIVSKRLNKAIKISDSKEEYYLEHYLAHRVQKFVATLGASPKASIWYNDMHTPPQRWFSVDELNAEWIVQPKSKLLAKYKNRALETRRFTGFSDGRFLHWNSGLGLLALIGAFLLYKWVPLSAFYSSFFLIQAAGMFFIVWARWRYLYFLYLGGLYLIFVLLLEYRLRKEKSGVPDA